jgi:hypothetical protein
MFVSCKALSVKSRESENHLMLKLFNQSVVIAWCLLAIGCAHDDPRLLGSWKSDMEQSMAWNRANQKMTAKQDSMLSQMFGHMTVTYHPDGTGLIDLDPYTWTSGTNVFVNQRFTNAITYNVMGSTATGVVVKTTSGFMPEMVETFYFDSADVYYLLLNEEEPEKSLREYFRRVK